MGFFSKIANFGSKILGGVKHAAQWVAPALHNVLLKVAGPVGMLHPGIEAALGAVYAANNQIIGGQASDFALKIAADGLLTVKNLKQELARQQHFRGYYLLNSDITSLPDSADGDFAFSAESGTVWIYGSTTGPIHTPSNEEESESESEDNGAINGIWYNSGDIVPDQVSPASDAVPLNSIVNGSAGISTEYARGDHQHPLQISSTIPSADTETGNAGTSTAYARADHQHILNVSDIVLVADGTASVGTSAAYARSYHQHPLNVDPNAANVPLVNATAAAVGTSDFYSRNDHVHPQQLTYDGNI
ncbi:MAG: hypothetical protein EZS28_024438, partial [Streblomastix strix]